MDTTIITEISSTTVTGSFSKGCLSCLACMIALWLIVNMQINLNKHLAMLNASSLNKLGLQLYHFSHRTSNDQIKCSFLLAAQSVLMWEYACSASKLGGVLNTLKASQRLKTDCGQNCQCHRQLLLGHPNHSSPLRVSFPLLVAIKVPGSIEKTDQATSGLCQLIQLP